MIFTVILKKRSSIQPNLNGITNNPGKNLINKS